MGDRLRQPSTDVVFSWPQLWLYFTSSFCTDEMRAFTIKNMNLVDALDGKLPEVQYEILEYAPKEILNHPVIRKLIYPNVLSQIEQHSHVNPSATSTESIETQINKFRAMWSKADAPKKQ